MKTLMKNKVFKIVITTDLTQQMCIWIRNIALLFYVMESTNNDPIAVSLLAVAEFAPIFIFAFIGGTLADRWNPKRTMISGDILSAASIAVIILLVSAGYWQAIFAATFISAAVSQFSLPSSQIIFKRHIPEEEVTTAIAFSQSSSALFMIIGPVIGTLVYTKLHIYGSLILIGLLFIVSVFVEMRLPSTPRINSMQGSKLTSEMLEGLRYVLKNRNLVIITITFVFLGIGLGVTQPLGVYVIMERLGLEKEKLQFFYSLYGVGMLAGGAVASIIAKKLKSKSVLFGGILFFSLSVAVEVLSVWPAVTAVMYLMTGVMLAFMQIVLGALMIKDVSEEYIGRTNGVISPVFIGGTLLGSAFSGILFETVSLIPTYLLSALIIFAGAFFCLGLKTDNPAENTDTKAVVRLANEQ